jgi:hypothetical protein
MATDRRQLAALIALLAVLGVLGYRQLAGTSRTGAPASNQTRAAAAPARNGAAPSAGAPDVHLEALNSERPRPAEADRNLFRFKPKAPPPPPPQQSRAAAPQPSTINAGPPQPPPLPPIALKFIGTMNTEGKTIAVLTDGQGPPMFGVEGQTIAGRYRILRIGAESIEMSYLDGRGRQTIRLTGQ